MSSYTKLDAVFLDHWEKTWEKNGLTYKVISKMLAKDMMLKNHYSKKWNNGHFGYVNIGIHKDGKLLGAAVYGHLNVPKSAFNIAKGIECLSHVLELNRMWVDDVLGKNTESQLISMAHKIIKEILPEVKVIQTFADGRLGCGTIYKASGFTYHGKWETMFIRCKKTQEVIHCVNISNYARPGGVVKAWDVILSGEYEKFSVYTYRYLFFLRRKAKKHCNYKQEPLPPYHKGELPYDKCLLPKQQQTYDKLVKSFEKKQRLDLVVKLNKLITDPAIKLTKYRVGVVQQPEKKGEQIDLFGEW